MPNIIQIREGVTQGDPLAMFAYGIGVLLLIKRTRSAYPDVIQPWYADDYGALGTFNNLERYFNSLKRYGPDQGSYSGPTKSIITVHPYNL